MTDDGTSRSEAAPAARAVGATKIYGQGEARVRAIDGIDIDFAPGAFTAIMGPSCCGKSTLVGGHHRGAIRGHLRGICRPPSCTARRV
jgi:ABC-type glutathione transport system ATPase component